MTMTANAIGVGCCGNCGSEVEVRCSGGCAEPDVELRPHPIASLAVPKDDGLCSFRKCRAPIPRRAKGVGRPSTRCEKHFQQGRRWNATIAANRAARGAV